MSIKVIAIGNVIMGDDGIGIRVLEKIRNRLEERGMECIIGETDFDYCISKISKEDFIFIIDAAYCGKNIGDVTVFSFEEYDLMKYGISQHGICLYNMLPLGLRAVKGYIIGIEIKNVNFSILLTKEISDKLDDICENVINSMKGL